MKRISRRLVSAVILTALVSAAFAPAAQAVAQGSLRGRVLDSDGLTPLSGVVVHLVRPGSEQTFAARPTDERGAFEAVAPSGTYAVLAETSRGAYLASGDLRLREGANPPVSLRLKQASPQEPTGGTAPPPSGATTTTKTLSPLAKWLIVGGIAVAGILVVDAVTSDESPASGF